MNSNMEKPYVVGIDIGGTNTVFGIVDARGTILASGSIKTGAYDEADNYVDEVCKNLLPLIIANGGVDKIKGIGIGAPNGNYYSGTIEFAPNLPWKGVIPLAAMFEERLGIPTALTNDANAAAIGEMTYGAARGMKDFIMITLGTGVGSGIVINGQWYTDTTVLPESWDILSYVAKTVVSADAVATAVWKLTVRLPVWRVLHVSSSLHVPNRVCCVPFRPKTSPLKMYTMQPFRVTSWHRIFLTLPVLFWERLLQTSLLSPVPKQLFCSVGWLSPEITSSSLSKKLLMTIS